MFFFLNSQTNKTLPTILIISNMFSVHFFPTFFEAFRRCRVPLRALLRQRRAQRPRRGKGALPGRPGRGHRTAVLLGRRLRRRGGRGSAGGAADGAAEAGDATAGGQQLGAAEPQAPGAV